MTENLILNGSTVSRIRRPVMTANGFISELDPSVKGHLEELNRLLAKRIFRRLSAREQLAAGLAESMVETFADEIADELPENGAEDLVDALEGTQEDPLGFVRRGVRRATVEPDVRRLFERTLTPKWVPAKLANSWAQDSLARTLRTADEAPDQITLAEYIDMTPGLTDLKYNFQDKLAASKLNTDANTKAILEGYPAIRDYLITYAYQVMELRDLNGVTNFILNNKNGAKNVANYAIVSAARTIIERDQLKVDAYNSDDSSFVTKLLASTPLLALNSFEPSLKSIIKDFVFNSDELFLINNAGIGDIPADMKPLLIKYVKNSPIPLDANNIKFFLPQFITQIKATTDFVDTTEADAAESEKDFEVIYLEDDKSTVQISQSAVKCAAQLYYCMIMGDELEVFNVVNYFTHKYLIRGEIEITDRHLREDLQMYVFSNRFTNLTTKKIVDRTRPAERQMFYRQVFNAGSGQITEELILNNEFPNLWKVLMLESARFLERAQESPHPENYVSPQNVMQAVEDLQYNLSTHCTGMANVITPLIYAELEFVIRRILMHDEILRQIAPARGTWWRVVETLYMGMRKTRPRATVLQNKARYGHKILSSVATYSPAAFEEEKTFFDFLSLVDAFITTQSILQEALTDSLKKGDEEEASPNGMGQSAYKPAGQENETAAPTDSDWDF